MATVAGMTSLLLFGAAALFLLAAPLVVLLVWAAMREQRRRVELREQALQGPIRAREQAARHP